MKSEKLWCTCLCICAYVKIFVQKIKVSPIIGELDTGVKFCLCKGDRILMFRKQINVEKGLII